MTAYEMTPEWEKEWKSGPLIEEKAMRFNDGKVQWSLVNFKSLEPMVRVLEFGATKYSPNNWKKGLEREKILESMMRHVAALIDGEEIDTESGQSHMGHIMCNAMFYNYFYDLTSGVNNNQKNEPDLDGK